MTDIKNLQLFPFDDDVVFENFCLDIWKRKLKDKNTQLNGRRGQTQNGVDIFGRIEGSNDWVGIQCKVKADRKISIQEIEKEIKKAENFNPSLTMLYIATTAKRDVNIQEMVRTLTTERHSQGKFDVSIYFWEDIMLDLSEESNIDIIKKYYSDFFIDHKQFGLSIGKVMSVSVEFEGQIGSGLEIMIGKTLEATPPEAFYDLNYWKGNYFIANWNYRRIDTFPIPCFPSDLDNVFDSYHDTYIIAHWLNSIENIDDFLYSDQEEHRVILSKEEHQLFLDTLERR